MRSNSVSSVAPRRLNFCCRKVVQYNPLLGIKGKPRITWPPFLSVSCSCAYVEECTTLKFDQHDACPCRVLRAVFDVTFKLFFFRFPGLHALRFFFPSFQKCSKDNIMEFALSGAMLWKDESSIPRCCLLRTC